MINHLLDPTAAKTTGDMTRLFGELANRADVNKDGSVSSQEFAQFLADLVASARAIKPTPSSADAAAGVLATVGGILAGFPATPAGLLEALPSLQKAVPGVTLRGRDELEIPDVGRINVGLSFGNSGGPIWTGGRQTQPSIR